MPPFPAAIGLWVRLLLQTEIEAKRSRPKDRSRERPRLPPTLRLLTLGYEAACTPVFGLRVLSNGQILAYKGEQTHDGLSRTQK
jgi:hypothetical protein